MPTKRQRVQAFQKQFSFQEAKIVRDQFEDRLKEAEEHLRAVSGSEKGPMGLTPDHIKETPEWRHAYKAMNIRLAEMRDFNSIFTTAFKHELKQERQEKFDQSPGPTM